MQGEELAPSLLPMQNGAHVIRADVQMRSDGNGYGVVIAQLTRRESAHEYVVWNVSKLRADDRWYADNGGYVSSLDSAQTIFEDRREVKG